MRGSWTESACGRFETFTEREGLERTLIATVRDKRSRVTIATATPLAVAFHVASNNQLKKEVDAALAPYRAALRHITST
ncbi:hypothetical protein [Shimia sp. MIT1388]|uniref:hypothetical protein n=1 Tax=Shimia sp. MIT1388 TaxID=3096992 RepID=UPI00399C01EE